MSRLQRALTPLVLIGLFCLDGCGTEETKEKPAVVERSSDIVAHWQHDIGSGIPHRATILRDGTEIVTIGQYNHGQWLLLLRHKGDSRFSIVTQNGETSEE